MVNKELNYPLFNKKRAQLKIQQMAFMLLALTLFFALIAMFFVGIKMSGLKERRTDLAKENAMLLSTRIANSPEFACGSSFGGTKLSCVDADKFLVLKESPDLIEKYKQVSGNSEDTFWGSEANIVIRKIYPKSEYNNIECNLANYPNCGILNLFEKEINSEYSTNVLLCRKEQSLDSDDYYNKCEIAKLMVTFKQWN